MTDQTIIAHERRITQIEASVSLLLRRMEALDRAADQAATDKRQAELRETGNLRRQLAEAEAKVRDLTPTPADGSGE